MANQREPRQAGIELRDIEITPQMIEAGVDAFWVDEVDEVGSAVIVQRVYRAMCQAHIGTSVQSLEPER